MEYILAKKILSKNKDLDWFGAEYYVNLYRGCSHGCIYCDSRSNCYNDADFDTIKPKKAAIAILQNELAKKRMHGVIDTGAMGDPYNPLEKDLELTRQFLFLANKYGFGVSISTKSSLIERDIDILSEISRKAPVICEISITTASDNLSNMIEPNVACSSLRFETIKKLENNGIYSGVLLMPVLPFIEDNESNILSIVKKANDVGAKFIYPYFGVTLRQNQRDWYYKKLYELFPDKKLVELYKSVYNRYECISVNEQELKQQFENKCKECGILFNMNEIINSYKYNHYPMQLSLFD